MTRTEYPIRTGTRSRRALWLFSAMAVVVGAAFLVWFYWMGSPNVTFDGDSATYRGSTTLDVGTTTFDFDATNYKNDNYGVAFIVGRLVDETMTEDDMVEYAENNPGRDVPPFLDGASLKVHFVDQEQVERDVNLTEGTWTVWANTNPGDTDRAHFAAIIEVK